MRHTSGPTENKDLRCLSGLGAWALAFGCSVGWGSFVMPGSTFLPIAGPVGSAIGLALGSLAMLVLGANYHFLMNRYPDSGGVYTYTKHSFGYDHGFVSAWFMIVTYIAIIWANATALPLIARTLLGSTFQFGFDYEVAGFHVYMGEILLAISSLVLAAIICLRRKKAYAAQIMMAILLFAGIVICFVAAFGTEGGGTDAFSPAYAPGTTSYGGILTIFALAPWAFVGFESISHSAADAKFSLKKSFRILTVSVIIAAAAYIFLNLLAVMALPEGVSSWPEYIANLGKYTGVASQPTFFAAFTALGNKGSVILGVAAVCGIFTGLIGNYIALSRLLSNMSEDGLLPGWIGKKNRNGEPSNAILGILAVSVLLPFFGRTAISWIVDVTTVGATIAYAFASAAALRTARKENNRRFVVTGIAGTVISFLFALLFLVPNIIAVTTLSTESYLILAAWSILGFAVFYRILRHDREHRFSRSIVAWVVLLALIIFTSSVWLRQTTDHAIDRTVEPILAHYEEEPSGTEAPSEEFLTETLDGISDSMLLGVVIQVTLIVGALIILLEINARMQKRERQTEIEKALAEESSRAKTSFLSNMSHEIRTPMNAIIGLDNIALRDPNLPPRTREHLEKIGASAHHLLGLINDILDMSRIESGRMVLKNEEFSLREFLDQINIIINGQCQDKGLRYECNIIGHVDDYYYGDDLKLKQVLINILGNSVKFTDAPGEVSLTVEMREKNKDSCTMCFVMKDTGIGMDPEYIPKIFDAFSQEDATSTNRYGGSGLGMAITKNFVEMMNGEIQVESAKGVGSVFTVIVTLKTSERTAHEEHQITLPADLRVLIVDDDEISAEHTGVVLEVFGIKADTSSDAHEALQRIQYAQEMGQNYHLIVTDYKMPGMDGLELSSRIREITGEKTAILLLTGYNWDIIDEEAEKAGIDSILGKPLFSDTFIKKIHEVLQKRAGTELPGITKEEEIEADSVLAGCHVLMAEDVEQNAEILLDLLELEDVTAEHAKNGEEAVRMFNESSPGHFDAILMDVRMPVMDGLSATKAIRALDHPDAESIPIIAMTANVFDEDVERSHEAGMNAHLSKPVEPDRLYSTMARLISEHRKK